MGVLEAMNHLVGTIRPTAPPPTATGADYRMNRFDGPSRNAADRYRRGQI